MNDREFLKCLRDLFPGIELELDDIVIFLKNIGLMNPGGSFYKEREKKAYEVIYFSSHVVRAVNNISRKREVTLLDCGCGRSYLAFFVNYILRKLSRKIDFIGVDSNAELIEASPKIRDELNFDNMQFYQGRIIDFEPKGRVDIVCALHACDTATDEAIASGIKLNARYIIAAPCCQRQIVRQLSKTSENIPPIEPMVCTKIGKEYLGVALTETLRKLALEIFGYKVDMFEFISTRYTPKNILLRAEKKGTWNNEILKKYKDLRNYFNVKPKIEEYLTQLI